MKEENNNAGFLEDSHGPLAGAVNAGDISEEKPCKPTSEEVKALRLDASKVINTLRAFTPSRYLNLAVTSLELGRMMLGDVLAVYKEPYPYKPGQYSPADVTDDVYEYANISMVQALKNLRFLLGGYQARTLQWKSCAELFEGLPWEEADKLEMAVGDAYLNFRHAKLWLGQELGEQERKAGGAGLAVSEK